MSISLVLYLTLFVLFAALALIRPVWGVCLYMLTFFASPPYWWWGRSLAQYRWSLYGGVGLLIAVLISNSLQSRKRADPPKVRRLRFLGMLILLNATAVHFVLSRSWSVSLPSYELLAKLVLLFFLLVAAIRTERDFRLVLLTFVIGMGYIGWEATINDRGHIVKGRLEGVGAPGADHANQLASLAVTILPLAGVLFLTGSWKDKVITFLATPFILNVLLLCNSRGAFLSAIASAGVFLVFAPGKIRRQALKLLALGAVALWLLLGDPQIIERFATSFVDTKELDASASSRLDYWKAGLRMISDYPLGAGGFGFKRVHGPKYIRQVNSDEFNARSVHNGFINEACEWGIQGLGLRMMFVLTGFLLTFRTLRDCVARNQTSQALLGCALLSSLSAFLSSCVFGDFMDAEWGYWCVALMCVYGRIFAPQNFPATVARPVAYVAPAVEIPANATVA